MCKLTKYVRNCVVLWKNYTGNKNFTWPPVAKVATSFNSERSMIFGEGILFLLSLSLFVICCLTLFVICCCLLFLIVCHLLLFVVCSCLSFVIVCCLSFVIVCCLSFFVVFCLSLFVMCFCLSFVVCCCLLFQAEKAILQLCKKCKKIEIINYFTTK